MKRNKTNKRKGMWGGNAMMPADAMATHDIGNFAATQQQAGSSMGHTPDLSLIQSGGRSRKGRGRRKQRGGMHELQPSEIGGSTGLLSTGGGQQGGYFKNLFKSAMAPFGLKGLNTYSRKGKSRLSKRLRSHRNRR